MAIFLGLPGTLGNQSHLETLRDCWSAGAVGPVYVYRPNALLTHPQQVLKFLTKIKFCIHRRHTAWGLFFSATPFSILFPDQNSDIQLEGLWEHCELPQRGLGRSPVPGEITHFSS